MRRLLAADFARLRKNRVFWAVCIFMFVFGLYLVWNKYMDKNSNYMWAVLDQGFFAYTVVVGFGAAVFGSLFLGTEYSDGTIRNKLIIGHTRGSIYLANLITNIAAAFAMCLSFLVPVSLLGIPLIGGLKAPAKVILAMLLGSFLLAVAFCAIVTLIGMVCSSKAAVAVASLLLMIALFICAGTVNGILEAPEYITGYSLSDTGELEQHTEPNPKYLTESQRAVWQFIYDFLPAGQAIQYASMAAVDLWQMPLYSLLISAGATLAGTMIFGRKDIK